MKRVEIVGLGVKYSTAKLLGPSDIAGTEESRGAPHRLRRIERPRARLRSFAPAPNGHTGSEAAADASACSMASSLDQVRPIDHAVSKA